MFFFPTYKSVSFSHPSLCLEQKVDFHNTFFLYQSTEEGGDNEPLEARRQICPQVKGGNGGLGPFGEVWALKAQSSAEVPMTTAISRGDPGAAFASVFKCSFCDVLRVPFF